MSSAGPPGAGRALSTAGRAAAGRVLRRAARLRNRGFTSALVHDPAAAPLLLSPHLDDAVLDCWSVLRSPGGRVVTVFAGVPGAGHTTHWDRIVGADDSAALMRARLAEDAVVLARLSRTPTNLPFLEHQQRAHRPEPSFARIDRALSRAVPRASRVLAPMSLGTIHPDHRLLREYALALHAGGMPVTLYADVPYATVYGWPHWVTAGDRDPYLDVEAYWHPSLSWAGALPPARVVALDDADAAAKLETMRLYRTQFPSLDRGPIGQLSNPRVHRYEVFWDLG